MTLENELAIYDHVLDLLTKAENMQQLKRWLTREKRQIQIQKRKIEQYLAPYKRNY